jgi:hypothetical protein
MEGHRIHPLQPRPESASSVRWITNGLLAGGGTRMSEGVASQRRDRAPIPAAMARAAIVRAAWCGTRSIRRAQRSFCASLNASKRLVLE